VALIEREHFVERPAIPTLSEAGVRSRTEAARRFLQDREIGAPT